MRTACIIVTHNGERWIRACLDSVRESQTALLTVVVDNCSRDATTTIIEAEYPEISLMKSAGNLGFGQANNIGLRRALQDGADYVFLLNQDAWLNHGSLAELVRLAQQNPDFGVISPLHLDGSGEKLDLPFQQKLTRNQGFVAACVLGKDWPHDLVEVPFINAAAWLVSRQCLLNVGGFNTAFFLYGEDNNYCQRVLDRGYKIGICPTASICHDRAGTVKVMSPERRREWAYIQELVSIMHPGAGFSRTTRIGFALRSVRRCLRGWLRSAGDGLSSLRCRTRILRDYKRLRECRVEQESGVSPFLTEQAAQEPLKQG